MGRVSLEVSVNRESVPGTGSVAKLVPSSLGPVVPILRNSALAPGVGNERLRK